MKDDCDLITQMIYATNALLPEEYRVDVTNKTDRQILDEMMISFKKLEKIKHERH